MKRLSALILASLSLFTFVHGSDVINLNNNWRYTPGYEVQKNVYDEISLPHTWNTRDALGGNIDYYRGMGNYERDLFVPDSLENNRLFLKFHGVNTVANVFINGKHIGEHRGGYTAFTFEITDHVTVGEKNEIQVRVTNALQLDVMPLVGDFNMYGGIYRDVDLLIKNQTCISPLHYGSSGIYLTQKEVSEENAEVEASIMLSGEPGKNVDVELNILRDQDKILTTSKSTKINQNGKGNIKIPFSIENPRLWNGRKDPFMYDVDIELTHNKQLLDSGKSKLGLRYFHIDPDKGFSLNGEYIPLKGVTRHQDRPEIGNALSFMHHEEDVALMKEVGANAVRLSHYPQAEYMYELLDEAGMIVWSEIPFVGPGGYRDKGFVDQESFKENGRQQLKEMIYQQYNHPSICLWGLFNELKEDGDNPVEYVRELNALTKEIDPSRITTAASNRSGELNKITDIISWNLYFGWYGGMPEDVGNWADETHKKFPETPIGISEYGAGASIYHQQEELKKPDANSYWHPENWQTHFHEQHWIAIDKRPFLWGTFIWNLFDFGAAHRTEGEVPGKNDKGIITFDRSTKKDAFFFYKANWNPEAPMVHIAQKRLKERSSKPQTIKVYSNQEKVELFVNGKSLGEKEGDNYERFIWEDIDLKKGKNQIKVQTNSKLTDEAIFLSSPRKVSEQ
ncbi:MAG: glycoside hydrolase family 2 protein [Bacteroidota bacterium]